MEQAFRELAVNAVRIAGKAVKLTVSVGENAKELCVCFQDNGPGIPAEDAERIFEPYVTKHSGSGLGLTTVRRIIEAHGGSICAAESDGGARFIIKIPQKGDVK
jgi:signal transduction histidine kinase